MEELKQAIIAPDGKIRCPICGRVAGVISGQETVRNFKIRCRSSRKNHEHYFVLNVESEGK